MCIGKCVIARMNIQLNDINQVQIYGDTNFKSELIVGIAIPAFI